MSDGEIHSLHQDGHKSSHDPACDECRTRKVKCNKAFPKCSNCRKSNLACRFSNKGKRVNHTKKLINDIERLDSRLGKIEDALFRCLSAVETSSSGLSRSNISNSTTKTSTARTITNNRACTSTDEIMADLYHSDDSADEHLHQGQYYVFADDKDQERFYGHGSIFSLYTEAQVASQQLLSCLPPYELKSRTQQRHNLLYNRLKEASELFQNLARESESPSLQEPEIGQSAPCIPPRELMDAFLDTYFKYLDPLLPIFDRQSITHYMESVYSCTTETADLATIASFNYIVLQTLTSKLDASRKVGLAAIGSLEDDFISNLLLNAKRCYDNFQRLLKPTVANIQALFCLALTALKYFRFTMFETVFAQACQLSKSIGLHHEMARHNRTTGSLELERHRLFWSLFIVDKHVSLMAGKPCLFPSYDCSALLPLAEDHFTARVRLAHIQEDLYRNLYSAQVRHVGRDSIDRRTRRLESRLQIWAAQHASLLSTIDAESITPLAEQCSLELNNVLHTCWILLYRRTASPESRKLRLEHARTSLLLVQEMALKQKGEYDISVFNNLWLNYSIIPFLEVYIRLIQQYQAGDQSLDCESLLFFAVRAKSMARKASSGSYTSKISHIATICSQIVDTLCALSSGSQEHSPTSMPLIDPGTHSTQRVSSFDSIELTELIQSTTMPDPFWDTYSFPIESPLHVEKTAIYAAPEDRTEHIDDEDIFIIPENILAQMMAADTTILESFSNKDGHNRGL